MFDVKKTTLSDHCRDNVLLIPDGMFEFSDAHPVMSHGRAGIFRKYIRQDLTGVEFYTNAPCLAYVQAGRELFHTPDGDEITVAAGDMLMIPRNHHMVSDFVNADGPLEAWLFFFSDAVIERFLQDVPAQKQPDSSSVPCLFAGSPCLKAFVAALPEVYRDISASRALVNSKLLELLLLLAHQDHGAQLHQFLINQNPAHARRNIKQVMRQNAGLDLSVADYAQLAGRSLSAFQRDFKREFGQPPGVWLRTARLDRGRELVVNSTEAISAIAHHVGYADTSHFIRAFKERFGDTPKQLRQRLN